MREIKKERKKGIKPRKEKNDPMYAWTLAQRILAGIMLLILSPLIILTVLILSWTEHRDYGGEE